MQPLEYKLAMAGRRLATFTFFPIASLVAYLSMRSEVIDGVTFIQFDALTIVGICVSLALALITGYWWGECGDGWPDRFRLIAGCSPLFVLVSRLDPLGLTPTF
jgi:phosphoglycerol transferase MdoB-like AlkP superfamily enzyme